MLTPFWTWSPHLRMGREDCPTSQDPLDLTELLLLPEMGSLAPFLDTGPPCRLRKACLVHFCAWILRKVEHRERAEAAPPTLAWLSEAHGPRLPGWGCVCLHVSNSQGVGSLTPCPSSRHARKCLSTLCWYPRKHWLSLQHLFMYLLQNSYFFSLCKSSTYSLQNSQTIKHLMRREREQKSSLNPTPQGLSLRLTPCGPLAR